MSESVRDRAVPPLCALCLLLMLTVQFWLSFLARIIPGPLLPQLEGELGLDHGQAGSLFFWQSAGYCVALLGSGHIAARLGHSRTVLLSVLGTGLVMAAISTAGTLAELRAWLVALGLVGGLYLPSAIALITSSFASSAWGRALAVHELAPNLAFIAAPVLTALSLSSLGWRPAVLCLAATCCLAALVFFAVTTGPPGGQAMVIPGGQCRGILRRWIFWRMVLLFAMGITGTIGVYSILPLYLVSTLAMTAEQANLLLGGTRIPSLLAALAGGWCLDRWGARRTIATVMTVSAAALALLACAGLAHASWLLTVQATAAVGFFPAGFAVLARLAPPAGRSLLVALVIPPAFLVGGGLVPALIGLLAREGFFRQGIALSSILIALGVLLALRLPGMDGERQEEQSLCS